MPDSQDLYLTHREALESAIAAICRRFRLAAADAEDFAGEFRLRLVAEDYASLRQFQHRSSLNTYLRVVVMRAFQDWRNARWGKWRPSAEAQRLGPIALRLETLVVRDLYTLDEAAEILRTNLGLNLDRGALEAMVARFPARQSRRMVTEAELKDTPSSTSAPDSGLERRQAAESAHWAGRALRDAIARLPAQDQLILRLRFHDCLPISDIARALHLDQKPLYRRIDRLLATLREDLERSGLTRDKATETLELDGFGLLAAPRDGSLGARPLSHPTDARARETRGSSS